MTIMAFLSSLLRFSALAFIAGFLFVNKSHSQDLPTRTSQKLIDRKPDILYFADTDHSNFRLLSIFTELVSQIKSADPEYNCIALEMDKQMFQPALNVFINGEKSWKDSLGAAQSDFEKRMEVKGGIALRNLTSKPFLSGIRDLDVKVFAIDLADKSIKSLFEKGLSGDRISLKKFLDLAVNFRNSVMAENIYQILNAKDERGEPLCGKVLVFVGGKHLAEGNIVTPIIGGEYNYQSIASHPVLESYSQAAHKILDCNSEKNIKRCSQEKDFRGDSFTVENLFSPKDLFETVFMKNSTTENQSSSFPKIQYTIMVLLED